MPCVIWQTLGEPFHGVPIRDRIPGYMWSEMVRETDVTDVLQYYTLPDLGVYVRERMVCQSVMVPTGTLHASASTSATISPSGGTADGTNAGSKKKQNRQKHASGGSRRSSAGRNSAGRSSAGRSNNQGASGESSVCIMPAVSHSCCPLSGSQARNDHHSRLSSQKLSSQKLAHMELVGDTVLAAQDDAVCLPRSCTSMGCIHGSLVAVLLGSVMPLCKRASQCRRLQPASPIVRSAVSCCSLMEFTMACSLVTAMMLGLYPRGRKTAIFDVRVRIIRRMHELVTGCYSMDTRRTFILDNLPVLQLAFAEYAYNFIVDFMPVEADILGITPSIAVSYATTCDQFREKFILTGMETWEALSVSANTQIDKLIRNMRMGPVQGARAEHPLGGEGSSCSIMPICTSSAPKKRRTASSSAASATTMHHFYQTGGGDSSMQPHLMVGEGDIVLLHDYLGGHRQDGFASGSHPAYASSLPTIGRSSPYPIRIAALAGDHHHTRLAETSTGVHCHPSGSGASMLHKPIVSIPKAPVSSALLDLHVCRTDGLSKLYPSLPPADLATLQVLHTRVSISLLPQSIAMEQQNSLERFFLGNCVRMAAARSIYICTSCALGGESDVAFVGSFLAHTDMDLVIQHPRTGRPVPLLSECV